MIDREKVKKGLKCCKASTNDDPFQRCSECPYNDISISVQDCRAVLSEDALRLLKEQEPAKVRHLRNAKVTVHDEIVFTDECGNCSCYLLKHWKACPICGKPVIWE